MVSATETMTSSEAARRLGVGMRQVERLLAAGDLTRVGTVGRAALIDATSVHRLGTRGVRRGRPWSAETSSAAVDLLTAGETGRLGSTERSRLISRLRHMSAEDLVRAIWGRASVRRYRASTSFIDRIRQEVTLTGSSAVDADGAIAGQFGLAAAQRLEVDGYVDSATAQQLIARFHLVDDARGNVTLRVTDNEQGGRRIASTVIVALDLAESLDSRERAAALALLRDRLELLQ